VNDATWQQFSPRQYNQPSQRQSQQQSRSGLICFLCNRAGHLARNCLVRPKTAAMVRIKEEKVRSLREEIKELGALCDATVDEPGEPLEETKIEVNVAARQPAKTQSTARTKSAPAHYCQALIAVCQNCGQHHPVVVDACQTKNLMSGETDASSEGYSRGSYSERTERHRLFRSDSSSVVFS